MSGVYEINAPTVFGEILDDEAVVLNMTSGHYFSIPGSGALIWAAIEQQAPVEDIAAAFAARFDLPIEDAHRDVGQFIDQLLGHDLVRPCTRDGVTNGTNGAAHPPEWCAGTGAYSAPTIEPFSDMQDILLLDPIHDVDDAGWPVSNRKLG